MKAIAKVLTGLMLTLALAGVAQSTVQTRGDVPAGAGSDVPSTSASAWHMETMSDEVGLSGSQPFVTVLCKFADVKDEPATPAYFEELLATAHRGLDVYWREASYGRINLDGSRIAGWYTLPNPVSAYADAGGTEIDFDKLTADCIAAADANVYFPDYVGINLVFNHDFPGGARGGRSSVELDEVAKVYGVTWIWPAWFRHHAVIAHEMGHAFGLRHSTAGEDREYDNAWDLMSNTGAWWPRPTYNAIPQHLSAYQKDQLGWIAMDKKFVALAEAEVTLTLERLALPGSAGYLMVQIPIAGSADRFYTVEARRRIGHDRYLPADAVVIYEVDASRPLPALLVSREDDGDGSTSESAWTVGMTFSDPAHGITVSVDVETGTGFVVTITSRPSRVVGE